eukprot:5516322-Amphidinium_carterae.1
MRNPTESFHREEGEWKRIFCEGQELPLGQVGDAASESWIESDAGGFRCIQPSICFAVSVGNGAEKREPTLKAVPFGT